MKLILLFCLIALHSCFFCSAQIHLSKSKYDSLARNGCGTIANTEKVFSRTDVIAEFKGGVKAWWDYFDKEINLLQTKHGAVDSIDSVKVFFVVTKKGNICRVNFIQGSVVLFNTLKRILEKSPTWIPASSAGRNLNAFRILKIEVKYENVANRFKVIRNWKSYDIEGEWLKFE